MLGRFTLLFDVAHKIPIFGSSRIPVRYHLWVSLAVAALAGVGVDRLSRPGVVRLRAAIPDDWGPRRRLAGRSSSTPTQPVWTEPSRWTSAYQRCAVPMARQ